MPDFPASVQEKPMAACRRGAASRNSLWTSSGNPPFAQIPSGQGTAECRSRKFRLDEQRHSAGRGNSPWTSNGNPPVVGISFGRATAFCRWREFPLDEQRHSAVPCPSANSSHYEDCFRSDRTLSCRCVMSSVRLASLCSSGTASQASPLTTSSVPASSAVL